MNDIANATALTVTERLATLPPEVQTLFANPVNGTPDNISKAGCLALARLGRDAWNAWRNVFPSTGESSQLKNSADFSSVDFRENPVDFSGFVFGDDADFSHTEWGDGADFSHTEWGDGADFSHTEWGHEANFAGARWGDLANFQGAQWGDFACFRDAQWGDLADFRVAQWGVEAHFQGAQWGVGTEFSGAQWDYGANFQNTRWGALANFRGLSWKAYVMHCCDYEHFQGAKNRAENRGLSPDSFQSISFAGAHFAGEVDFSNRKFTGHTNFGKLPANLPKLSVKRDENRRVLFDETGNWLWAEDPEPRRHVQFDKAPKFHGCELHQDTTFDGAVFPPASGSDEAARAYRTLKLAFNKQQALREEQRFFKLEMEEEALREYGLKSKLFWAYKHFSDYGFSVWLPLRWALRVSGLLMLIYGVLSLIGNCWLANACEFAPQWLTFSLLHTLPVPGIDKMAEAAGKVFLPAGGWWQLGVSVLVIVHKAVVIAALFLAGLALRNLFRLK